MSFKTVIPRRKTRQIMVGNVAVGGDAPISVQSMTNTETCDVEATLGQIRRLVTAGVDIVRVSVPSMEAAEAFKAIRAQVQVPLVADIHFDRIKPVIHNRDSLIKQIILHADAGSNPLHQQINTLDRLGTTIDRTCG